MRIKIPEFESKKELYGYLTANKSKLIDQKKSLPITADPCNFGALQLHTKDTDTETKANKPVVEDTDVLRVKVVANTANWIDSHMDMILPDAPAKSIRERKGMIPQLHSHLHSFEGEIGDVVDIYLSDISLRELGLNKSGSTQALIFISDILKEYNPKVFDKYKRGKVKQHSIGLQYVKLDLAINDPEWGKEKDFWDKYYPQVINKEVADDAGYFWVVPEYKLIENSAVLFGSNILTPTLDNNIKSEPVATTQQKEPSQDTRFLNALNELLTKIN